jgi:hypothetical protein
MGESLQEGISHWIGTSLWSGVPEEFATFSARHVSVNIFCLCDLAQLLLL